MSNVLAPSLIIGVGGIGCEICARVQKEFYRVRKENGVNPEQSNIRFMAIDTDVNSIRKLRYEYGFQGKSICLSDNMSVGMCKQIINDKKIDEWFPENSMFQRKSMTEGAGQLRSISRLAFEYALRDNRLKQLADLLEELNKIPNTPSNQQCRVYVISSLAGGTGSGAILPLGLYLQQSLKKMQADDKAMCKGFFILSSAFYASCGSELEKQSLDANSYAAIKELSAFMRKADKANDYIQKEIGVVNPAVRMLAKVAGQEEDTAILNFSMHNLRLDEISAYDYCYLFGMRNSKGNTINSFEDLKDMVADAVYMQACSPMHDANSSIEDNMIKQCITLAATQGEDWLRRFGGIGCGKLIYPYQKIRKYIGLRWAEMTMSKEWGKYDEHFFRQVKIEEERNKRRFRSTAGIKRSSLYVQDVESKNTQIEFILSPLILAQCAPRTAERKAPWTCYLDALENKLTTDMNIAIAALDESTKLIANNTHLDQLDQKGRGRRLAEARYDAAQKLKGSWQELRESYKHAVDINALERDAFRLHSWEDGIASEEFDELYLEHWLIRDGKFIHPNAARYFFYKLKLELTERLESSYTGSSRNEGEIELNFDLNDGPKRISFKKGYEYRQRYEDTKEKLKENVKRTLLQNLLKQCDNYVTGLIRCYEEFYENYSAILIEFHSGICELEKELTPHNGIANSYVCADELCRNALFEEVCLSNGDGSYLERSISNISHKIFELANVTVNAPIGKTYKMVTRESLNEILKFWYDCIEDDNAGGSGEKLKMNILEALNKEEKIRYHRDLTAEVLVENLKRMVDGQFSPFIQYFHRIGMNLNSGICCYHSDLEKSVGEFEKNAVKALKKEFRGVPEDTCCSIREIMFYSSFVGLDAYEVHDFMHGIGTDTDIEGEAFHSYNTLLQQSGSMKDSSKIITPHSDKKWNNLEILRDPSCTYQKEQELYTAVALLYACFSGTIKKNAGKYTFCLPVEVTAALNDETITKKTLEECHLEIYSNRCWLMQLLSEFLKVIRNCCKDNKLPYDEMRGRFMELHPDQDDEMEVMASSIFNIIILYMGELTYQNCEFGEKRFLQLRAAALRFLETCNVLDQEVRQQYGRAKELAEEKGRQAKKYQLILDYFNNHSI